MTNPTPTTPTGDSVTNPAGSVRENDAPWITDAARELAMDSAHIPLIANIISRHHARERAAVEKALAAWDASNAEIDLEESEAFAELRAIHAETKGNTK